MLDWYYWWVSVTRQNNFAVPQERVKGTIRDNKRPSLNFLEIKRDLDNNDIYAEITYSECNAMLFLLMLLGNGVKMRSE